jgi:hypothetical protein
VTPVPGFLVTTSAVINCAHLGSVRITPTQERVLVRELPVARAADQIVVVGCPGVPPSPPCTTARWLGVAPRVLVGGSPVLVQPTPPAGPVPGPGVCVGSPPPTVQVLAVQLQVVAG